MECHCPLEIHTWCSTPTNYLDVGKGVFFPLTLGKGSGGKVNISFFSIKKVIILGKLYFFTFTQIHQVAPDKSFATHYVTLIQSLFEWNNLNAKRRLQHLLPNITPVTLSTHHIVPNSLYHPWGILKPWCHPAETDLSDHFYGTKKFVLQSVFKAAVNYCSTAWPEGSAMASYLCVDFNREQDPFYTGKMESESEKQNISVIT